MLPRTIVQPSARAAGAARRTARSLVTGRAPGSPRQVGQIFRLGAPPNRAEHAQKSLVAVSSCAWTSRLMTVSCVMCGPRRSVCLASVLLCTIDARVAGFPGLVAWVLGPSRSVAAGKAHQKILLEDELLPRVVWRRMDTGVHADRVAR